MSTISPSAQTSPPTRKRNALAPLARARAPRPAPGPALVAAQRDSPDLRDDLDRCRAQHGRRVRVRIRSAHVVPPVCTGENPPLTDTLPRGVDGDIRDVIADAKARVPGRVRRERRRPHPSKTIASPTATRAKCGRRHRRQRDLDIAPTGNAARPHAPGPPRPTRAASPRPAASAAATRSRPPSAAETDRRLPHPAPAAAADRAAGSRRRDRTAGASTPASTPRSAGPVTRTAENPTAATQHRIDETDGERGFDAARDRGVARSRPRDRPPPSAGCPGIETTERHGRRPERRQRDHPASRQPSRTPAAPLAWRALDERRTRGQAREVERPARSPARSLAPFRRGGASPFAARRRRRPRLRRPRSDAGRGQNDPPVPKPRPDLVHHQGQRLPRTRRVCQEPGLDDMPSGTARH